MCSEEKIWRGGSEGGSMCGFFQRLRIEREKSKNFEYFTEAICS